MGWRLALSLVEPRGGLSSGTLWSPTEDELSLSTLHSATYLITYDEAGLPFLSACHSLTTTLSTWPRLNTCGACSLMAKFNRPTTTIRRFNSLSENLSRVLLSPSSPPRTILCTGPGISALSSSAWRVSSADRHRRPRRCVCGRRIKWMKKNGSLASAAQIPPYKMPAPEQFQISSIERLLEATSTPGLQVQVHQPATTNTWAPVSPCQGLPAINK